MPEAIEGVSSESVAPVIATDDNTNDSVDNSTTEATEEVVTEQAQESAEKVETQEAKPDVDDPKIPQNFRDHLKELESDIKVKYKPAIAGIEKVATDLFGTNTPEDVQATIQTVQALAPSIKVLTDPSASQADVVKTLQTMLPQEHVEAMAWAALNDPQTRPVIFDDPEVRQAISEDLLNGKSIEEVQALLANAPEAEVDPEKEAWRKERADFQAERERDRLQSEQTAARTRMQEFASRFYETTAQRVIADDLKLVAPEGASEQDKKDFEFAAKAAKFTAQALFIEQNGPAAEQLQMLHAKGARPTAEAIKSEINLANRYEATLIKTTQFFLNLLAARSDTTVKSQQDRINGVRPDVTGSVEGNGNNAEAPLWDYSKTDAENMKTFSASFHN